MKNSFFNNLNTLNRIKTGAIALPMFIAAVLSGCGKDGAEDDRINPEPSQPVEQTPPTPPVEKIDTVYIKLRSVQDFRNGMYTLRNADPKKTYIVDVEADFAADAADISGPLKEFNPMVSDKSNVKFTKNNHETYPNSKTGQAIGFDNWNNSVKLGLKASPSNGMSYLAETKQDSVEFGKNGYTLNVLNSEYGDATVITVSNESQISQKAAEARAAAASGKEVVFIMTGVFSVNNTSCAALESLFNNPSIKLVTEDARVSPSMDSVRVNYPSAFANTFTVTPSLPSSGKYFYVPGDSIGKTELAAKAGTVRTDTVNASSGNLKRGLMPGILNLDEDLSDFSGTEQSVSGYTKRITIAAGENSNAPGGKNRIYNLDPATYSTPTSRAAGEPEKTIRFLYDPVVGPYWKTTGALFQDVAKGKGFINSTLDYNFGYGNFYGDKMTASNKVAGQELMPVLSAETGLPLYYEISFSKNDIDYIWNIPSSFYGIEPNNYVLVSLESLHNILKNVFKLSLEEVALGNRMLFVDLKDINLVFSDDLFNYVKSKPNGQDSHTATRLAIDPFGRVRNVPGGIMSQSIVNEYNKKTK